MKLITSVMFMLGLSAAMVLAQAEPFTLNITVIDEETQEPIDRALVRVSFSPGGEFGGASRATTDTTNKDGKVLIKGKSIFAMPIGVEKDGWYSSGVSAPNKVPDEQGKYYPKKEQEIIIKLRRIKEPRALYAQKLTLGFPMKNEWIGFDLESADWVNPHGKGKTTDILFRVQTEYTDWRTAEGTLSIKFPRNGDGIYLEKENYLEASRMKMPYLAPKTGYEAQWSRTEKGVYNKEKITSAGYFIRVRAEKNGNEVIRANYAKVMPDFEFDPRETGWHVSHKDQPKKYAQISFTYYYNPTANDTNLEFDPDKNLFGDLPADKRVTAP